MVKTSCFQGLGTEDLTCPTVLPKKKKKEYIGYDFISMKFKNRLKSWMMTKFRIVVSCYKGWAGKEHEEIFWGTRNILHLFTIWLEVTGVHMEIKTIKLYS